MEKLLPLTIRQALANEFKSVIGFYHKLIDEMKTASYRPGWEKGVYPADDFIQASINNNEMFIGLWDKEIVSAMVVNQECNEGYDKVNWPNAFQRNEVMVIHALGILPSYQGRGIAKQMCKFVFQWAKDNQVKAIRLDVLGTNKSAQSLYIALNFQYVDTIEMYYEDTGLTDYLLYEYIV